MQRHTQTLTQIKLNVEFEANLFLKSESSKHNIVYCLEKENT